MQSDFKNVFKLKTWFIYPFSYLHGCIVHNHAVKGDVWVTGGHLSATLQEQAIAELPVRAERKRSTFPPSQKLTPNKLTPLYKNEEPRGLPQIYMCVRAAHMMLAL